MPDESSASSSINADCHHPGWQPDQGWHGLVPDKSTLDDLVAVLGQPSGESELANARCYDFLDGLIRATFLNEEHTLFKVWVSGKLSDRRVIPANLDEAQALYGQMKAVRIEKTVGVIYERPGLRMACEDATEPKLVKWIEFFKPRT